MTDPGAEKKSFQLGAVILAAGAATRMGQPKQVLPIGGVPLLVRVIEAALASPAWPIVVVVGAHAEIVLPLVLRFPVIVARNPSWAEGMASSIRAGMDALERYAVMSDAVLFTVCDQPHFSSAAIARLLEAFTTNGQIAAAAYNDQLGVPAIFSRAHFDSLRALTGTDGARKIIARNRSMVAKVDLPDLGLDLDTPEDYEKFTGRPPRFP
jgi:CTP:molybdopterin cytidylyltransferase MocA